MSHTHLTIGQISYLNVLPLFQTLKRHFPPSSGIRYMPGHPSEMNSALEHGEIDLSPASAFEYLANAERYRLLPGLSITAPSGPVKSVLLVSPVALEELPRWMAENGNDIHVTRASASSVALLKTLWSFHWKLPTANWVPITPGTGLDCKRPFLEIGNFALQNWLNPPAGWHIIDLAEQWRAFTGLPFVFAVWIVRNGLSDAQRELLADVHTALLHCKAACHESIGEISEMKDICGWISREGIEDYLSTLDYDLGPREEASLVLFGDYCRRLGLIPGVPGLRWAL
ncbi:chorismate dehydratase [Desulfobaculum xiamenense]|uniref:Chorismate dehydratase n=1 Tax=Desulfobaculum xiamenense TaxID=995050 RepID=A0A846QKR1_9BACT|nr:menaquinone biosynthesis protein [Desulfobaculum xiamenense]NJB66773.1 chorismate dehydratase [Desulfobaculum xiamenense]